MEIVIVNSENKEYVSRLEYSLGRAGLIKTEDYLVGGDRTLVFREKGSSWFLPIKNGENKGVALKDAIKKELANSGSTAHLGTIKFD